MRFFLLMIVLVVISCKPDGASTSNGVKTSDQKEIQNTTSVDQKTASKTKDRNQTEKGQDAILKTKNAKGGTPAKAIAKTNFNKEGIPDACDLLTAKTVAKYVRQPAETIFLADGSSPQNPKSRSCFFKWDGSELANAGVLVQLQRNPVQQDVPEYFTYLIAGKKTDGEKDPASKSVIKYNDWPGFGDDGAYSTEAGKYVWRVGNDWSFMVAFNTVLDPKAQKVAADAFAREVMTNMTF